MVTPNIREAALLTGAAVDDVAAMVARRAGLAGTGARAVVVKGGHLAGDRAPDVVLVDGEVDVLDGPRVATANDHGTGCTLSAAIAAHLARGTDCSRRLAQAKAYVATALAARRTGTWGRTRSARPLRLGPPSGPSSAAARAA